MILLSVQDVSKAFVMDKVLEHVSFTLHENSRMGLVGVNGSGKSTLISMIAGEQVPDSGVIALEKGASVGLLTQQADIISELTVRQELERVFEPVRRMEERLRFLEGEIAEKHSDSSEYSRLTDEYSRLTDRFEEAGGYEWPSRIQGVLAGLGFADDKRDQRADSLSGGEKTRLCLARLLLMRPDLLMLDEPTNHLDLKSTAWLEETLKKYKGAVILISHDRYFLNAVCDCISEISMTKLTYYEGDYDAFARQRREARERREKEYVIQQAEIARQQAIIARYRAYNTERSHRAARSRENMLDKIERVERPMSEQRVRFSFGARRRSGDDVLIAKGLKKGFSGRTLFDNVDLHLRLGDRVAIIGPNGIGKSTLLNIIAGRLRADAGELVFGSNIDLGYYDQQQSTLHPEKDVMSEVWDEFPRLEPNDIRSLLALFLFIGEDVFKKVSALSGGERGRVELAKLMLRRDNLLLLDEPTNHLDMDSREVLENALNDFEGTLLTVSHDRYFINKVANRIIEISDSGVREYIGNYDDYIEKKRFEAEYAEEAASGATRTRLEKEKRRRRLAEEGKKALAARLKSVEREIGEAELRLVGIEMRMGDPEAYKNGGGEDLAREHAALQKQIDALYEEWSDVSEAAGNV